MATLSDMVEHCDNCGAELDIGQIGLCDDCQSAAAEDADLPNGNVACG